jgi:hypothetical protein
MHNVPAATVQETAQIVEGAAQVDVGDVNMPVFMRLQRLNETGPFEGLLAVPLSEQPLLLQHPICAGRADGYDVLVEHHEGQPAIAFERVVQVELDDLLALPVFEPEIPRDRRVVLVGLTVTLNPGVKLALGD